MTGLDLEAGAVPGTVYAGGSELDAQAFDAVTGDRAAYQPANARAKVWAVAVEGNDLLLGRTRSRARG